MYCTEPASTVDQNVFRIIIYLCILSRVLGVFTRERIKNKKSLDAYIYYQSGWMENVYCPTKFHNSDTRCSMLMSNHRRESTNPLFNHGLP